VANEESQGDKNEAKEEKEAVPKNEVT